MKYYCENNHLLFDTDPTKQHCRECASALSPEELARECWKIAVRDFIGDEGASQIDSLDEVAISQIATLLRSRMERAERWIPVSEALPREGDWVLVCFMGNEVHIGVYGCGDWYMAKEDFKIADRFAPVTHWRPLPSAPDTEKKA